MLESAFSDNSASDYLPPKTDPFSPSSSTSATSSDQGGVAKHFIEQINKIICISWFLFMHEYILVTHKCNNLVSAGMLPVQPNLQQRSPTQSQPPPHFSPPPWDTLCLEQTEVVKREYHFLKNHINVSIVHHGSCCIYHTGMGTFDSNIQLHMSYLDFVLYSGP